MNSAYMASRDGLDTDCFAWASGNPPLAVWTDLQNLGALLGAAAANQPQLWTPDRPRRSAWLGQLVSPVEGVEYRKEGS